MSETDLFYSEESDGMSKRTQLEEYFSQSLEVELLLRLCPDDEDIIYQIVDLLVDTCATKRKMLRVAGDDRPAEVVRSRFMKLNADHIKFVLKCLAENSSPIRNMKQFLCRRENERCLMLPSRYEKVDVEDFIREHLFFYDDAEMRHVGVALSEVA